MGWFRACWRMREWILGQKKRHSRSGEMGNLHFLSDIKKLGSFVGHRRKSVGGDLGAASGRERGQKKIFRRQKLVGRWSCFVLLRWLISSPWLFGCSSSTIDFWLGLMMRRRGEAAGWGRLGGCCFLSWSEERLEWRKLLPAKYANFDWMGFWLSSSQISCSAGWVPPSPTLFFLGLFFGSSALGWFFVWLGSLFFLFDWGARF